MKRTMKHKSKSVRLSWGGIRHKREPKQGNEEGLEGSPKRGGRPGPRGEGKLGRTMRSREERLVAFGAEACDQSESVASRAVSKTAAASSSRRER